MAKLYSTIMEQRISTWLEHHHKQVVDQTRFRPKHFNGNHLVTLKVIMEESKLRRETLRYSFMQFKKPFDIVPRSELWKRM